MENIGRNKKALKASLLLINLTVDTATTLLLVTAPVPLGQGQSSFWWSPSGYLASSRTGTPKHNLHQACSCRPLMLFALPCSLIQTTWICSKNYRNAFIYVLFTVRTARRPDVRAYKCCCAVRPAWGCQNKTQPMLHAQKEKQKMKPFQMNWLTVASKLSFTAFAVSVAPLQTEWLEASFLQRP